MEWIREGRIGDLKMALCTLGFCPPKNPENRYLSPELGGGAMYDIGVYAIEITQYLMGEPITEVKTMMSCEEMQVDVMDQVLLRFMLTMGNGSTPDWKLDSLKALYDETLQYGSW